MKAANHLLGLALVLIAPLAVAQQPSTANLDGVWRGRIQLPTSGREYQAELNLASNEGTWRVMVKNSNDPCVGLLTPVSWRPAGTDGGIELTFLGSKALTGCNDTVMAFRRVDDKTFQGKSASGFDITLTRP
jgi:hypothetical protein